MKIRKSPISLWYERQVSRLIKRHDKAERCRCLLSQMGINHSSLTDDEVIDKVAAISGTISAVLKRGGLTMEEANSALTATDK